MLAIDFPNCGNSRAIAEKSMGTTAAMVDDVDQERK
jgi:hypothetical protein